MNDGISTLVTEQNNPNTTNIDQRSTKEMLEMINREDSTVHQAVAVEIPRIAEAVDGIVSGIKQGGRLIYIGAGTSGRLGILDASECPPTYGTSPELVVGIIAGGIPAILNATEGLEDCEERGVHDVKSMNVTANDTVIGIAASGRTPYVLSALREANKLNAFTIGICNNAHSAMESICKVTISVIVGPEVIMGSTRMKAGTAQKLVLNMISTSVMIKLGKVYKNVMVDMNSKNQKLFQRSVRMVELLAETTSDIATKTLNSVDGKVKTAILMLKGGIDADRADRILKRVGGELRNALEQLENLKNESDNVYS